MEDGKGAVDVQVNAHGEVYVVDASVVPEESECRGKASHAPAKTVAGSYRAWREHLCLVNPALAAALGSAFQKRMEYPRR